MRARARLVLLAAFVGVLLSGFFPSHANALISYYGCYMKPVNQWCDGKANGTFDGLHSWDFHQGWHAGAWDGSVIVCEQMYDPSTGASLPNSQCDFDSVDHYYGNITCACYEAEIKQYSNPSGPRSINGYADASYF
jgi:hypothetical protein